MGEKLRSLFITSQAVQVAISSHLQQSQYTFCASCMIILSIVLLRNWSPLQRVIMSRKFAFIQKRTDIAGCIKFACVFEE